MAEPLALGRADVGERGGGGRQAEGEIADAEGVERGDAEVRAELGRGATAGEDGGVAERERGAGRLQAREQRAATAQRLGHEDLAWPPQQRRRQHAALGSGVLAGQELARRHVEQGDANAVGQGATLRRDGEQVVVGGAGEIGGVGQRARRDHADDVALEELLALARRLHLLTDGDLLSGLYQARDVAIGRVVRDAGHRRALPGGERDGQQPRAQLGVLQEELVEVAEPEQQQVVGKAALQLPVLLHHRGVGPGAGRSAAHATRLRRRSHVAVSSSGSTRVSPTTVRKL